MVSINIGNNIEFLDSLAASSLVINNVKNEYLNDLSKWEIKARTNNIANNQIEYLSELKKSFKNFTPINKNLVFRATKDAQKKLEITNSFENLPFRFAFLSSKIDWGYTYTTGDIIVLRDNDFLRDYNNLVNLIIHEYCHVYQRFYLDMLNDLYSSWGFKKVNLENKLIGNTVLNPDGIDNWMFKYNNKNYIPILVGNSNNQFIPFAFQIENNKIINSKIEINSMDSFSDMFFNVGQLYHPNEIMAHLVPLYLDKKLIAKNKNQQQVIDNLERWLFK